MRGGLITAAVLGAALLLAALAGVESAAEHWRNAQRRAAVQRPAFVGELPETLPSVTEVEDAGGVASPTFTR